MRSTFSSLVATIVAVLAAQPALAITFPQLTTIYVGSGVRASSSGAFVGVATTFQCSNVSGVAANVRFLILSQTGSALDSVTLTVAHGGTLTVSTHNTIAYTENFFFDFEDPDVQLNSGAVNIESTQSAVFCNAKTLRAASVEPVGSWLPLVRVNPHPDTME